MPIVGQFGSLGSAGFFVPGGSLESIATITAGSGGTTSVTFSDIPGGFQHLQVRALLYGTGGAGSAGWLSARANGNTNSGQRSHRIRATGSTCVAENSSDNQMYHALIDNSSAGAYAAFVLDILDYASTTKNKTFRGFSGNDRNGAGDLILSSSLYASTSAITSLTLLTTSMTLTYAQHSTWALYGVRA